MDEGADGDAEADAGDGQTGDRRADAAEETDADWHAPAGEGTTHELVECVRARGHENVRGEHGSTLEVTTDDWLTPAGDCILAVAADRAPADLPGAFRAACRDPDATITATLRVFAEDTDDPSHEATVRGRGHPDLTLESDRSAVCRTSEYVDDRTVMVDADHAAADVDRSLVAALAEGADVEFVLRVR